MADGVTATPRTRRSALGLTTRDLDRGVIFATVTNALSEATLAGAVVTAKKEGTQTTVSPLASSYLGGGLFYRKYPAEQIMT